MKHWSTPVMNCVRTLALPMRHDQLIMYVAAIIQVKLCLIGSGFLKMILVGHQRFVGKYAPILNDVEFQIFMIDCGSAIREVKTIVN